MWQRVLLAGIGTALRLRIMFIPVLLAAVSLLLAGCEATPELNRSDPSAVAQAAFRAIMAKDYLQLRALVGPAGNIPDEQAWSHASFFHDDTPGEGIKQRWVNGALGGYNLNELTLDDPQGFQYRPEKLVQIHFVLAGKGYLATFPIAHVGNQWSPGMNPIKSDFFIRFEEV